MNYIGKKVIALKEYDNANREAVLGDVRCVHYWERAAGLAQVAMDGVGSNSRLTMVVPEMAVMDVIEIIPCSDKAIANLEGQKIWKI